jgi:lipopolysaccharide biosynthesis glycosyltransferase
MDADTLVLDDVTKLWRCGLRGRALGAVQDPILLTFASGDLPLDKTGISRRARYFNSGVLLMDLARWRKEDLAVKVLETAHQLSNVGWFPDQDALNMVFAGKWQKLHPRWNCALESAERHAGCPDIPDGFKYAAAVDRPGILHYFGGPKPWQPRCLNGRLFLYFHYLDRTRWAGWRPT